VPRGIAKIQELDKEAKARSAAYESGAAFQRGLYLKPGQTAKGRFCEEGSDVWYLFFHQLPPKPGQRYGDKVLCLDQPFTAEEEANYVEGSKPCYGCELEGVTRSQRVVINFIRYDEPKLVRDEKGKPVKNGNDFVFDGVEPALVVCSFATGAGGRIAFLESQYGPLSKHVCMVTKTDDNTNPFMIDVLEANKLPPDHWEIDLNDKKVSPPKAITSLSPKFMSIPLMSYGDMRRAFGGVGVASGFQGGDQAQPSGSASGNIYEQATQNAAGGHINLGAFGG
jgi:hypothetical protein